MNRSYPSSGSSLAFLTTTRLKSENEEEESGLLRQNRVILFFLPSKQDWVIKRIQFVFLLVTDKDLTTPHKYTRQTELPPCFFLNNTEFGKRNSRTELTNHGCEPLFLYSLV
jgi:hypothetical protein